MRQEARGRGMYRGERARVCCAGVLGRVQVGREGCMVGHGEAEGGGKEGTEP